MSHALSPDALDVMKRFHAAFMAGNFTEAASLVKDLLAHQVVLQIEANHGYRLTFAEWTPGNADYRASCGLVLSYQAFTMPSPTRRDGNYWSGGHSSGLGSEAPFVGSKQLTGIDLRGVVSAFKGVPGLRPAR